MCLWQNGQKNPRLKTTSTFFRSVKSESDTLIPLKSSNVNSGACVFSSTLAMIGSLLGDGPKKLDSVISSESAKI
jgi:hypothetical protein